MFLSVSLNYFSSALVLFMPPDGTVKPTIGE
jgi:hypothetical protein